MRCSKVLIEHLMNRNDPFFQGFLRAQFSARKAQSLLPLFRKQMKIFLSLE
jgi:hypothetical protein